MQRPFYRPLNQELVLALTGECLYHRTFLLALPSSCSPGARDGQSIVTVLLFSQEWTASTQTQGITARSRFTVVGDGWTINARTVGPGQGENGEVRAERMAIALGHLLGRHPGIGGGCLANSIRHRNVHGGVGADRV